MVRLWDARTLAPLAAEQAHTGRVTALQFSAAADGRELLSAGEDGALVAWAVGGQR